MKFNIAIDNIRRESSVFGELWLHVSYLNAITLSLYATLCSHDRLGSPLYVKNGGHMVTIDQPSVCLQTNLPLLLQQQLNLIVFWASMISIVKLLFYLQS